MSPRSQRIAIAELCGWIKKYPDDDIWQKGDEMAFLNDSSNYRQLPDYLNDLNAIHEAEQIIPKELERHSWRAHLEEICGTMGGMLHSSASQRSQAFLETFNAWDDSK